VAVLAAGAVAASRGLGRSSEAARTTGLLATGFAVALVIFYGLFFGAGHFMSRYLFPISPFLALLTTAAALHAVRLRPRLAGVAAAVVLLLVAVLQARVYLGGSTHEHFQVVRWVESNVPDETWVGAVQTGTLGFFHDRTINLDGKVNPAALVARQADQIPEYVAESEIQYLADWIGIVTWADRHPAIAEQFEVLVADPDKNLGVLGRPEAPRKGNRRAAAESNAS
jgi:hypothetical protein